MKRAVFVVLSSPSGGGKDTIILRLLKVFSDSARLVTTTTRKPRVNDTAGVSYNFVSEDSFKKKIKDGEMLEYNIYNGNYYGIEKRVLSETLAGSSFVFTNIDVNGKASLDKNNIAHIAIFLLPESLKVLERRIRERGGLTEDEIKNRLNIAKKEMKKADIYDYEVKNRDGKIEQTVEKIKEIIDKKTRM
ncbi:MAG TPA: guanylate kinase [Patescibacteria group bacterium]|uniref:Guanylate kinase n=3 Tax=Candidatus Magasanikiibacteriota TaxID=1752731 RepID=A0A1F6NDR3_9BACT|nr:MAG: hypothetical protein A2224_03610 [Candidatus Magasanikbacteria bacterium RIFOXYA2_FULL_40_20]OGH82064.1 MAG: hypothetical protein A2373_03460 [Candidatus Magasanikbacteria bacterium RIFOXYB1_FULL_40_15]OGH85080.1 MAG: hypothetical protein A2301_02655 [Candidatus Magasanikbacteria bacterium RIFOXYB2_FULL_40_13]OGH87153.1 MAG: hypothetical protein A2206_02305 [Candidatus Magasanikbacteria bacterium RIFOXYA1_FULL_40_8]OGH89913.1 MAG: hypothetical protein A2469_04195 [Candidatus Magasanikba